MSYASPRIQTGSRPGEIVAVCRLPGRRPAVARQRYAPVAAALARRAGLTKVQRAQLGIDLGLDDFELGALVSGDYMGPSAAMGEVELGRRRRRRRFGRRLRKRIKRAASRVRKVVKKTAPIVRKVGRVARKVTKTIAKSKIVKAAAKVVKNPIFQSALAAIPPVGTAVAAGIRGAQLAAKVVKAVKRGSKKAKAIIGVARGIRKAIRSPKSIGRKIMSKVTSVAKRYGVPVTASPVKAAAILAAKAKATKATVSRSPFVRAVRANPAAYRAAVSAPKRVSVTARSVPSAGRVYQVRVPSGRVVPVTL